MTQTDTVCTIYHYFKLLKNKRLNDGYVLPEGSTVRQFDFSNEKGYALLETCGYNESVKRIFYAKFGPIHNKDNEVVSVGASESFTSKEEYENKQQEKKIEWKFLSENTQKNKNNL